MMTAMKAQRRRTRRSEVFVFPQGLTTHFEQKKAGTAKATTIIANTVGGGKVRISTGSYHTSDSAKSQSTINVSITEKMPYYPMPPQVIR
jgi:hypothetical protein